LAKFFSISFAIAKLIEKNLANIKNGKRDLYF